MKSREDREATIAKALGFTPRTAVTKEQLITAGDRVWSERLAVSDAEYRDGYHYALKTWSVASGTTVAGVLVAIWRRRHPDRMEPTWADIESMEAR